MLEKAEDQAQAYEQHQAEDQAQEIEEVESVEDEPELTEDDDEESQQEESEESEGESDEDDFYFGDDKLDSPSSEEDESEDESAPKWVKELRTQHKELTKRNKELEDKLVTQTPKAQPVTELEAKPRLESFDYDEDAHEKALDNWYTKKSEYDRNKSEAEASQKKLQDDHVKRIERYNERKLKLRVTGYDAAEKLVIEQLPQSTQAAIIHYSDFPEMVVLAAGRNADIREKLAKTTDPVELGRLIGSIESKARLAPKSGKGVSKTPQVKTSGGGQVASIERALDKARKSGNYNEVIRLKRKLK